MAREMKDSGIEWIGNIPVTWTLMRVKHFFNISRGRVIPVTSLLSNGKYPVFSSQTENNGCFGYLNTFDYKGPSITWTTDGAKAGTVFFRDGKYNCTNVCGILQLKTKFKNNSNLKFFTYAISMVAEKNKRYDINGFKIMSNEMANIKFAYPCLKEQLLIANLLDKKCSVIDSLTADIEKQISLLEDYKKSIITGAVTKGLNPNVEFKDSGIEWIGKIPKHWEITKIKNLGNARNGLTYSPSNLCDENSGTLVLRSSNIKNGKLSFDDNVFVNCLIKNNLKVKKGDILICSRNGSAKLIGKSALIDRDLNSSFGAFMMIFRSKLNTRYIKYILESDVFKFNLSSYLTSTINQLTNQNFSNMKIVFCNSEKEQKEIVDFLDKKCSEIDSLISDKKEQLEKLASYKQSMIYEYVTGKKEIPTQEIA